MPNVSAVDPLSRLLTRLERRRRVVVLGRSLGLTLAIAALVGLFGIGLDLAFFLPQSARWVVWGVWLGGIGMSLAIPAFRAFARPADLLALASRAERGNPSAPLEALTATVSLMRAPHGSPVLIAAVAAQATALVDRIESHRVIPSRHAVRRLTTGSALISMFVAPAILAPPGVVRTEVRRFLLPWANLERVGAFTIAVDPGDGRAAIGSRPEIHVVARGDAETISPPDEAWIEWRDIEASGPPRRLAMGGSTGQFSTSLPHIKGSIAYRALVGGDVGASRTSGWWRLDPATSASRWYRIDAAEPPRVVGLRVTVEPPRYTKRPPALIAIADGASSIEAWQDSRIILEVSADASLRSLSVDFESDGTNAPYRPVSHAGAIAADRRSATVTLSAEASGSLAISLVDEHGIAGAAESLHRLVVHVDGPPTVTVEEFDRLSKDHSIEARPDDVVRIGVSAADDMAVASVDLQYEVERTDIDQADMGTDSGHSAIPSALSTRVSLPGLGTSHVRGEAALRLEPLGLRPGDRLTYRLRVADNRPLPRGPNVAFSEIRSIAIVRRAETLAERRRDAARAAVQAQLDDVKRATKRLRQEAERLRYAADAARQGSGAWNAERQRSLVDREGDSGRLIQDLQRLATLFETRPDPWGRPDPETDYHALAPAVRAAAEREGESSRASFAQASRTQPEASSTALHRLNSLREADGHLADLTTRLDELQARFDATKPKGRARPGQGSESSKTDLASKSSSPKSGAERGDEDRDGDSHAGKQRGDEKPGESSRSGEKAAGKRQSGRASDPEKPGSGSAPAGYPAAHEDAEPIPEANSGDLAKLRDALRSRSGRPWAELPGQLRSKILRMPQVRFRDEYARQIERYYRALAEPGRTGERQLDE